MCDSLPTISAEQLTKAVSLAAAGTLSALELDSSEDGWRNDDSVTEALQASETEGKSPTSKSSLQLLETLSTSITSSLGKLNQLSLDTSNTSTIQYPSRNPGSSMVKNKNTAESSPSPVLKKYSSRKNYKLLPPLIPSQVRATCRKPGPKTVLQRQLVTLSHRPNLLSPQELKSLPVRPASYSTNYLFVRTQFVPPPQGAISSGVSAGTPQESVEDKSLAPLNVSSATSVSDRNVGSDSTTPVVIASSAPIAMTPGTPASTQILLPVTTCVSASQGIPSGSQLMVASLNESKQSLNLLPVSKFTPVFRLPLAPSNAQSLALTRPTIVSKENEVYTLGVAKQAENSQPLASLPLTSMIHHGSPISVISKPASTHIKHFLVPASSSSSSPSQNGSSVPLSSSTHPVTVISKTVPSMPTMYSNAKAILPKISNVISNPQAVLVTSGTNPAELAGSSSQLPVSGTVNSFLVSPAPGQFFIASPNFQIISPSSSVQSAGTSVSQPLVTVSGSPSMVPKSSAVSPSTPSTTHQSNAQQSNTALAQIKSVTAVSTSLAVSQPSDVKSGYILTSANAESGQTSILWPQPLSVPVSKDSSALNIRSTQPVPFQSTSQLIQGREQVSSLINNSWNLSKPITATVIAVQPGITGSSPNSSKASKISLPVQSTHSLSQKDKTIDSPALVLPSPGPPGLSNVCAAGSQTNPGPNFRVAPSLTALVTTSVTSVSQTPCQLSSSIVGSVPQKVNALTTSAKSPAQKVPSALFSAPSRPQLAQKFTGITRNTVLSSPSTPQSQAQIGGFVVTDKQKAGGNFEVAGTSPSASVTEVRSTSHQILSQIACQSGQSSSSSTVLPVSSSAPTAVSVSAEANESLPLSKAAAAAAMVSLASVDDSAFASPITAIKTSTPFVSHPNFLNISHPASIPSRPAPEQFLVPSPDGTKLVLSPAGIQHLQSLLRKQGISEGYFVITSPRIPPAFSSPRSQLKETFSNLSSQVIAQTSSVDKDTSLRETLRKLPTPVSSVHASVTRLPTAALKRMPEESVTNSDVKEVSANSNAQGSKIKEHNMAMESDGSDNENCSSSSGSRASSAALIIETGEEDERMDTDRPCREAISDDDAPAKGNSSADVVSVATDTVDASEQSSPKHIQDTAWEAAENGQGDHARHCIPQSPLSLCDLVRQQHTKTSFGKQLEYSFLTSPDNKMKESEVIRKADSTSPRLPTSDNDFQFPVPVCPASAYGTIGHQQQMDTEVQASFQHGTYAPSSFSSDLTFDSSVQPHPGMESRINHQVREASTSTSPKIPSNTMNAASPKSPLSVNSGQTLDQGVPLNPPMTPNTMLINLLNRVPTPLLTNHQDLLTAPTSQDNPVHGSETASDFEMSSNKTNERLYSGKTLHYSSNDNHVQMNGTQANSDNFLYSDNSRSISSNPESYNSAANTVELIAANYASNDGRNNGQVHDTSSNQLSSSFMMASKAFDEASFGHDMQSAAPSGSYTESYHQGSDDPNAYHSFHCKSCSSPLLVTVNLDSDTPAFAVTLSNKQREKVSENHLENFQQSHIFGQSLILQEQTCTQERSDASSSMAFEKSSETDILRHLILNTSSSSFHTLQPAQGLTSQHFDASTSAFTLPQDHRPQEFECRVESFLEPENPHKNLSRADLEPNSSFSTQEESFLHLDRVHPQPSPSFDSSGTSFKAGSFQAAAHQSYENTVSSTFDSETNSALGNQASSTYALQANMTSDTSFTVPDMSKANMPIPHDFLVADNRLQHIPSFRSENHEDEMFFQHSHTQQNNLHHNHYDPANPHQDHSLEYHLDSLPPAHQPHQFSSSSLSHPDSTRMFSGHMDNGNVVYLNEQYPPQYYDGGNVTSEVPMFSQQCAVGSEAPALGSTAGHPCNMQFSSAPAGLQLEFRFPPEDDEANNIEKQPVLPSASFSPPSVADQAATPDPGGMSMYNGTFPNLSMYDLYMRGGNGDARVPNDAAPETGNFCVECNVMYKAQCKFHPCDYTYVSDTPILSHARLTLPGCLKLGTSSIVGHTNSTGVFAKEKIAVRTKFGPLIGSAVSCDKLGSTRSFSLWQTFTGTNTKVVDTSDENSSNWLMFVKPARVSVEQNLVAFQHGNSVYFVTRMDIEPDQELLYWFARDYSRMLGITARPRNARHQLCPHCTVCKQVFPDSKQVRSHMRLQHPKPCTKKCSHCPCRFLKVSHLNAHVMSVHLRVQKFVCAECGKKFSDGSNFKKHIKTHSDERLFKCQMCGKDFRQKSHLKLHMNTHMPVKNEQCGFCGKRFTRAFTRRQHEMQHTKQNKIQCVHCDKVYYKQKVYKQHLKIHRNERNYMCSHCRRGFRSKSDLTRHGPACKQRKCVVIPPPPPPPPPQPSHPALPPHPTPQAPPLSGGDFLHTNHTDVSMPAFSNDAKTHNDTV